MEGVQMGAEGLSAIEEASNPHLLRIMIVAFNIISLDGRLSNTLKSVGRQLLSQATSTQGLQLQTDAQKLVSHLKGSMHILGHQEENDVAVCSSIHNDLLASQGHNDLLASQRNCVGLLTNLTSSSQQHLPTAPSDNSSQSTPYLSPVQNSNPTSPHISVAFSQSQQLLSHRLLNTPSEHPRSSHPSTYTTPSTKTLTPDPCSPNASIYADGVFDLTHSGHFNALRQAKMLGKKLVVGVCSDEEVKKTKGVYPIYDQSERAELVKGCKWVDDVVEGTPYTVTVEFLKSTGCDYVAHGDDFAPNADGADCYSQPAAAGLLKVFRRTVGISSTSLICRLLRVTAVISPPTVSLSNPKSIIDWLADEGSVSLLDSKAETSAQRLLQFIGDRRQPRTRDKVVYVDGSFDVFHVGHLRILQKAKQLGDYLIVGIHDDETVAKVKGYGFPVMSLVERALNVLAMKVVDDVVLGAPWVVSQKIIRNFNISTVVSGSIIDARLPLVPSIPTDTTHIDTTHIDTTHIDTTHIDTTHIDTTHIDTTDIDTTDIDTTDIDTTDIDTTDIDITDTTDYRHTTDIDITDTTDYRHTTDIFGTNSIPFTHHSPIYCNEYDTEDVKQSPKNAHTSPKNAHTSPKNAHTSPKNAHTSNGETNPYGYGMQSKELAEIDIYEIPRQRGIFVEYESQSTLTTGEIILRIMKNRTSLLACLKERSKKEVTAQDNCLGVSHKSPPLKTNGSPLVATVKKISETLNT